MMKYALDLAKNLYHKYPSLYMKLPIIEALNSKFYRKIYMKRIERKMGEFLGGALDVEIEVTNKCNADCIMCPNGVMERPIAYMEMDLFTKVIDEIVEARLPVQKFSFCGLGEPTLDTRLAEKMRYIKSKGPYHIKLVTNASLLVAHRAKEIIDAGLDEVMISFNGTTKESYERVMRHMSYEKTMANLMTFLEHRKNGRPYVILSCVQLDANADDLAKMEDFWKGKGVEVNEFKKPVPFNRGGDSISFKSKWAFKEDDKHLWPCRTMGGTMLVHPDGRVVLCCMDYEANYIMGQFGKNTVKEIMKRKEEWFQKHKQGDFSITPMCKKCTVMNEQVLAWWMP